MTAQNKHLVRIGYIAKNFITTHQFNRAYFKLEGTVSSRVFSSLKITCNGEFDNLKLNEIKAIERNLYEEFRYYLEENNIEKTLYIEYSLSGWAVDRIVLYFKDEVMI